MSDTQNDSRNAVAYVDEKPVLELAADEYIHPIATQDDSLTLFVSMGPYQPYAVKKFYDQTLPKRKRRTTNQSAIERQDQSDMRAFVIAHFKSFFGAFLEDGSEPSFEQQKLWLEENTNFVDRIFDQGLNTIGPRNRGDEVKPGKAILVFGQKEQRIPLEYRLYSPERNIIETISLTAVLEKLSQSEKHQYDKATAVIDNSRRGELFYEGNWDVIEQICDRRMKHLEGAVFEGEPCSESNKEAWVKRLLLIPKFYIMAQAVQDVELKNG